MIMRALQAGLLAAAVILVALPADAGSKRDKRDPTFQLRSHETDFVKVYPGDQALGYGGEGGARTEGPDKGPYIDRCFWTFNNPFDSPLNPTQRCVRYTLENTQ